MKSSEYPINNRFTDERSRMQSVNFRCLIEGNLEDLCCVSQRSSRGLSFHLLINIRHLHAEVKCAFPCPWSESGVCEHQCVYNVYIVGASSRFEGGFWSMLNPLQKAPRSNLRILWQIPNALLATFQCFNFQAPRVCLHAVYTWFISPVKATIWLSGWLNLLAVGNGFRALLYGCLTMSKEPIIIRVSMQKMWETTLQNTNAKTK